VVKNHLAAEIIGRGGVIAFRTDTFYGLGADPFNRAAVNRIKELKGREDRKPILVVIGDFDQVDRFIADRTASFDRLAEQFWPGPLTLIAKAHAGVLDEITAGTGTIGVRLPADDEVVALIRLCGGALTATSANPSDQSPAKTATEVEEYFGERIDLILEGGPARTQQASTVVDAVGSEPKLIREGMIGWSEIQSSLNLKRN